jgi:hypothetical protein
MGSGNRLFKQEYERHDKYTQNTVKKQRGKTSKNYLTKIWCKGVEWIKLAQDRFR